MVQSVLAKKLQLKSDRQAIVINAPAGYADQLGPGISGELSGKPDNSVDFVQLFVKTNQEVDKLIPPVKKILKPDGLLWVSYPKVTSKVKTELNRDVLWQAMGKFGLTGVFLVSVDDVWSAMRFRPGDKVGK